MVNFRLFLLKEKKEKSKQQNFLKVFFQGPDLEKVNLPSIFRKYSDCIPQSFQTVDPPTVIYLRSRTIGSSVFNYKDTVDNVIAGDWKPESSLTCNCSKSNFCDPHHQHIVTGDLRFIENRKLRTLLSNGPTYREAQNVDWRKFSEDLKSGLDTCVSKWAKKEKVDESLLSEWKVKVFNETKSKVETLKKSCSKRKSATLSSKEVKSVLEKLQKDFVFVQTDKASNNIAIVCKKFYIEKSLKELGVLQKRKQDDNTYTKIDVDIKSIIKRHARYLKSNLGTVDMPEAFPFLYWIPKMHKKPFSKQRYIAASYSCTTKPLSQLLTKILKLVEKEHRKICRRYEKNYGVDPMWIIHNSKSFHSKAAKVNRKKEARNVRTYDFSTLYTSIPHKKLKSKLAWVISEAFKSSKHKFISIYQSDARWTNSPRDATQKVDCSKAIRLLNWLIDNIYVTFGDQCFRQTIGIPMGTDCAPFLANLFLYSYEYQWIDEQKKEKNWHVLNKFRNCCRYIDDLMLINNDDHMTKAMTDIYPEELILVPDGTDGSSCPFLDLQVVIRDHVISTSIYDKRDTYDFPIVNFPTLTGNIPKKSSYGVFTCELVRYARACTYYEDFKLRTLRLVTKLKKQFFKPKLLRRTWINFCDAHILLVQKYGPSVMSLYEEWM